MAAPASAFSLGRVLDAGRLRAEAVPWLRRYAPVIAGCAAAVLLFALVRLHTLNPLSANTDHPFPGYDFFGWPRCGLAVRLGQNAVMAAEQQRVYGPWATGWVSHPTLCIAAIPFSYLPPWTAFWTFNTLNLMLHLAIIITFGRKICREDFFGQSRADQARDLLVFVAMGLFMPWYVMYYMGQYHSFAVLALYLVLANPGNPVLGFTISAFGKPVLGPAGLVLLLRRRWRQVFVIGVLFLAGTLPWMYFSYSISGGLSFERSDQLDRFWGNSRNFLEISAFRWNQQISLSAALDEWLPATEHLPLRYLLASFAVGTGALVFIRKPFEVQVTACTLWFFFLYARGHEYHGTLYVPMLLALYTLPGGRYRGWSLAGIALLMALPTTYPLYHLFYNIDPGDSITNQVMIEHNRLLYHAFLWQKPLCAFLLLGLMLKKEWPYDRGEPLPSPPFRRRRPVAQEPAPNVTAVPGV